MGMDVFGNKPKSEKGEYFRNNVWWWHPLWDCCEHFFPEITSKVKHAHDNSGDGLNGKDARKLGFYLQEVIDNGQVEKYIEAFNQVKEEAEPQTCFYCDNQYALLEQSSDNQGYIFKVEHCKLCKGTGKVPNNIKSYSIDLENVQNFSEFLKDCGGFRIC